MNSLCNRRYFGNFCSWIRVINILTILFLLTTYPDNGGSLAKANLVSDISIAIPCQSSFCLQNTKVFVGILLRKSQPSTIVTRRHLESPWELCINDTMSQDKLPNIVNVIINVYNFTHIYNILKDHGQRDLFCIYRECCNNKTTHSFLANMMYFP